MDTVSKSTEEMARSYDSLLRNTLEKQNIREEGLREAKNNVLGQRRRPIEALEARAPPVLRLWS